MAKTILGIGAHYDDCIFGISGTLLGAVRKNHRVRYAEAFRAANAYPREVF